MPANVESMFSVRQMPWHREGTILADYPGNWAEARRLAGLDWDPVTTEVYAVNGINDDGTDFSISNAQSLESFAASNGVRELSFWEVDEYDKKVGYAYSKIFNAITG